MKVLTIERERGESCTKSEGERGEALGSERERGRGDRGGPTDDDGEQDKGERMSMSQREWLRVKWNWRGRRARKSYSSTILYIVVASECAPCSNRNPEEIKQKHFDICT